MKTKTALISSVIVLLLGISFAWSQENAKGPGGPGGPGKNWSEQRLAMLKDKLNLTDSQVVQIRTIFSESHKQVMAQRDSSVQNSDQARNAQIEHRKAIDDKIMKVLNDDQKKEYQKMIEERRKGMQGGRPSEMGMKTPKPPR